MCEECKRRYDEAPEEVKEGHSYSVREIAFEIVQFCKGRGWDVADTAAAARMLHGFLTLQMDEHVQAIVNDSADRGLSGVIRDAEKKGINLREPKPHGGLTFVEKPSGFTEEDPPPRPAAERPLKVRRIPPRRLQ